MVTTDIPVVVGCFGRPFGVFGWIKVISFTTPRDNILKFQPWLIQQQNQWQEILLEDSKKQANDIVVKLPHYKTPEEVRCLTNAKIAVWRQQLPQLPGDQYYWFDLVGLNVINKGGIEFGRVQDLMATGANDVLIVSGERRRLIPYISNVIINVDLENRKILVDWEEDF